LLYCVDKQYRKTTNKEAQNATVDELKALTTRICKDGRMFFTSDVNQIDLMNRNSSAAHFFEDISKLDGVNLVELKENFRHPLALEIMDLIDKKLDEKK